MGEHKVATACLLILVEIKAPASLVRYYANMTTIKLSKHNGKFTVTKT